MKFSLLDQIMTYLGASDRPMKKLANSPFKGVKFEVENFSRILFVSCGNTRSRVSYPFITSSVDAVPFYVKQANIG